VKIRFFLGTTPTSFANRDNVPEVRRDMRKLSNKYAFLQHWAVIASLAVDETWVFELFKKPNDTLNHCRIRKVSTYLDTGLDLKKVTPDITIKVTPRKLHEVFETIASHYAGKEYQIGDCQEFALDFLELFGFTYEEPSAQDIIYDSVLVSTCLQTLSVIAKNKF
jgi:hypothetical protein